MQSAYTFYILGLNLILASFSDQAVTALGLYYKWQTFFFIPLGFMLTVIRTVVLFVPLGFLFSRFGLDRFWLTFPVTEVITSLVGIGFYRRFLESDYVRNPANILLNQDELALKPSRPGVIVTIAREHGSSGKQIGRLVAEKLGVPFYYKEMVALAAHESGLDQEFISNIHKNRSRYPP